MSIDNEIAAAHGASRDRQNMEREGHGWLASPPPPLLLLAIRAPPSLCPLLLTAGFCGPGPPEAIKNYGSF